MKQICSLLLLLGLSSLGATAQSFSLQMGDTVYVNPCYTYTSHNNIVNNTASTVTLEWKVIENTYPADWFATLGICDNMTCLYNSDIAVGVNHETMPYPVTPVGDFHILGDLASTSTYGPYVVRVRFNNKAIPTDTALATFIVTKCGAPTIVPTTATPNLGNVSVYPNPATSTLNVTADAAADIKELAIYTVTGRHIATYAAAGTTTSINVENLPSGMYFIKLLNAQGNLVTTRKFNRQ